jgi:hypothetical protein
MAARAAAGRDAAACFGRSAAVASVRAMVRSNERVRLQNMTAVSWWMCAPSMSAVAAWSRLLSSVQAPPAREEGSRAVGDLICISKETKKMSADLFRKSQGMGQNQLLLQINMMLSMCTHRYSTSRNFGSSWIFCLDKLAWLPLNRSASGDGIASWGLMRLKGYGDAARLGRRPR